MGTIADKLAKLNATKADLKAALAEKGQTVGDVFSTYPAAVRAIETGGGLSELIDLGVAQEVGSGFKKTYKLTANNPPSGWEYCAFYIEKPGRHDGIIFDKTGSLFPPGTESTYAITVESNSVSVEASKGNFEKAPQGYAIFAK